MIEEFDTNVTHIPNGLAVAPTLVSISSRGRIPVQVANFTNDDLYLQPRTPLAMLSGTFTQYPGKPSQGAWQEMQADAKVASQI